MYHVSADGRWALTPDLRRMSRTQLGYGVHVPEEHMPRNRGAPHNDGLWVTDTRTGECRKLVSLAEVRHACVMQWNAMECNGMQCKMSR